ncbi:MAG TPA: DUF3726 domain-containing protein [Alphaproteobacteria bacterium]|nr:DUF3726 domain-containing protein [Alphaproteobacteria bacterium]
MTLSLNEIEVTVRKAALGSGLPLGLAEEAGAVAAWLAAVGFPVEDLMVSALEHSNDEALLLSRAGAIYRLTTNGGACAALRAAPSACDLVVAAARSGKPIAVEAAMDVPALAVAQAAVAARESGVEIAVWIGETLVARLVGESAILFGDMTELAALRSLPVRIRIAQDRDRLESRKFARPDLIAARDLALKDGVRMEPSSWERIRSLAARTLVPATMHSRERGAGAGLIDTD